MDITGSWQPAGTPFAATLPARSGLAAPVTHVALPVTSAELAVGGDLVFEARVATSGFTSFTGAERIRIRGRVEGTHNVVIE
jgi:hypothetical protein